MGNVTHANTQWLAQPMSRKHGGEMGVSVVSYAILLPVFLLLLVGSFQIWRLVAVKQALNRATYLAARDLGRALPTGVHRDAGYEVYRYLLTEPFIERQFADYGGVGRYLRVTLNRDPVPSLSAQDDNRLFEIRAQLFLPWFVRIPMVGSRSFSLSATHMGGFTAVEFERGREQDDPANVELADPEVGSWFVSPWPTSTLLPSK